MSSTTVLVGLVCLCGVVVGQVSFSTHWGTGKRASQLFDPQSPLANVFSDNTNNNNLVQCLTKMEYNIMRYMALAIEKEMKEARACLIAEKSVDYD